MQYEKFEYAKLVEALKSLEYDEDKVNYISLESLRCRSVVINIRNDIKKLEVDPIAIATKNAEINKLVEEALKDDSQFNHDIGKEILNIIEEKICSSYNDFIIQADDLKKHYEGAIELQVKTFYMRQNEKTRVTKKSTNGRIIWRAGEEKLLRLYKEMNKSELIPEYSKDEILNHFVNERLLRFNFINEPLEPFSWQGSDAEFSILISELAVRGAIPKENKFKVCGEHFLNNNGKQFKSLAQKKNYTENTNATGDYIRQILDKIEI